MWSLLLVLGVKSFCEFHLMFVHILLVRFGLMSGHLLGRSCPFDCVLTAFCLLVILVFPVPIHCLLVVVF